MVGFNPFVVLAINCPKQVGFDVPHVTNDMILRFMNVDFALLPGLAASSTSRVGSSNRISLSLANGAAAGLALLKGGSTDWEGE